jgi:hypothetical protein
MPRKSGGSLIGGRSLHAVDDKRLGDDVFDTKARVERGEGVLKDDLHIAAQAAHFARARREQVPAFEVNSAGGRLDQAQDEPAERALARARFADEAECLARMNVERNVVDGAHFSFSAGTSAQREFALRINLGEIAEFD